MLKKANILFKIATIFFQAGCNH